MALAPIEERLTTQENNRLFYNEISASYDTILEEDSSNGIIRNRVKEKFTSIVQSGCVLDFGGGTGLDLNWLVNRYERVIFCEPSEGMRRRAIAQNTDDGVVFLENDQVDFGTWHSKLPFTEKTDGILADFAVINCIADIELLFNNLAKVLKPGGHLMALMLNNAYKKNRQWQLLNAIKSVFPVKPVAINVQYKNHKQIVYMYTPKEIKKASAKCFDLNSREDLFEFTLFHFTRK